MAKIERERNDSHFTFANVHLNLWWTFLCFW